MARREAETLTRFTDLGVAEAIADALATENIIEPFPIQEMAIPLALTGTDLIAQARTGTGKTLAFGAPLLQRIVTTADRDHDQLDEFGKPQALVITPTRELASQVAEDLTIAGRGRQARVLTVYGGTGYEPQLDALQAGVDVVVGTPGRLLDLADRRALDLRHVKVLVLDEADRMLDLGFLDDVERLIAMTHELRQTMLFSATMPGDIVSLSRRHLRHPVNIRAESASDSQMVPATAQFVYQTHDLDKPEIVARILQAESAGRVILFCSTKRACQRLSDELHDRGFNAAAIHGDLTQVAREKNLERFRAGTVPVLVATDVAARGLDVEAVTHVVNYSCPDDEKTYLHRNGRTGRAGASGVAITLVDWADVPRWRSINKMLDLPFYDPPEIYSTSEQFYHDLGIPRATAGRRPGSTPPAQPRVGSDRAKRDAGGQGRGGSGRGDGRGGDGRGGRSAGRGDGRGDGRPGRGAESRERSSGRSDTAVAEQPAATVAAAETGSDTSRPQRQRRRRRRSSDQPAAAEVSPS